MTTTLGHLSRIGDLRAQLFALYEGEDIRPKHLRHKHQEVVGEMWTHGHQFLIGGKSACGSSIGEDEIRLFFELSDLVDDRPSCTIGVAFGLSLFALALARPEVRAIGIDNYSDWRGEGTDYVRDLVQRLMETRVPNAELVIGSSPGVTSKALDGPVSIAFIDGLHTNEAAAADFDGLSPFLDSRSIVLWHDTPQVRHALRTTFDQTRWDRLDILRTYRRMGLFYNSREHPAIEEYVKLGSLRIRKAQR